MPGAPGSNAANNKFNSASATTTAIPIIASTMKILERVMSASRGGARGFRTISPVESGAVAGTLLVKPPYPPAAGSGVTGKSDQ
jgi:hypothetical protein